ncbi:MAG: VOC family protein [Acidobacteriota bacterium]
MENVVSQLLEQYENGEISRRQIVTALAAALATRAGGLSPVEARTESGTFEAVGLHHIALGVSDVARSRDFYVRHLDLEVSSEWLPNQCFLDCGPDFVALFRSSIPGLHHYSYAIPDYDQQQAAERLRAAGLEPRLEGGRIYFDDPDGIVVQLSQAHE